MLSFFFEEVFKVGVLLPSQSFKILSIVDAPPLLMTKTGTTDDPLLKLIGAITDVTEKTMPDSTFKDFWSLCVSEKATMTKKSLLRFH